MSNNVVAQAVLAGSKAYDLLSCEHCDVTFFEPLPTPAELAQHYSKAYTFYKGDNFKAQGKGYAFAKKYLKHKNKGNFIDIGCASGDVLAGVREASNWQVFGTDINPEVVANVREKLQLDVRVGEIEHIKFDEDFFDFIRVQDILEHVPQPLAFLKECRRIIRDDGLLYLSVPNGLADVQNLIDYYNKYNKAGFSGAGHIYFFSIAALNKLFKSCGFQVEKSYSVNFKKGLRSLSVLPKSKHWQRDLTPPSTQALEAAQPQVESCGQQKRGQRYYNFQFFKDELAQISRTYTYAQDFVFILRPIISE
ncbi:MAG: class I SAM-dependent methyltransferase [Ghiorsea sp.]|nr:class I SAM-dependent methyltransferase [Ghiorsea sp.]